MKAVLFAALLMVSLAFPFSIDYYSSAVSVQPDGGLLVNETMVFTLEEQYNEGYRSIRPVDYGTLNDLVVHSVKVNGRPVSYYTQENGGSAEIVWTETFIGKNEVELIYTLKDRVELWDDFAKICFEHYGANWPVPASVFQSTMTLPEAARGKEMHFEVYSDKKGEAYVDGLSIVIEMEDVPPGNYVGGCYLFDRSSVSTSNTVNGSAYEMLQQERGLYGSEEIFGGEDDFCAPCCFPMFLIFIAAAAYAWNSRPKFRKLQENIMPPSDEEPAAVSVLLRGEYKPNEVLAATLLELISRGVVDIMELEKKGYSGPELRRERTILFLKSSSRKLKPYEKAVIGMIFDEGRKKEVDLDALAEEFSKISGKEEAKKTLIPKKMDEFTKEIDGILKDRKLNAHSTACKEKRATLMGVGAFVLFAGFFLLPFSLGVLEYVFSLFSAGDYAYASAILLSLLGSIAAAIAAAYFYYKPPIPKGWQAQYEEWDAFSRAVRASSLKRVPPSGALIWGEILAYATVLGIADKVKRHLSELDSFLAKKVEKLDGVRASSMAFYSSAWGVRNLSKYGNRGGPRSSGFSSGSSGGWSSGGGGGFSGGSSGGGGFR